MGDRKQLQSPVGRAKIGVAIWFDALPEGIRLDAEAALDRLCEVVEREVEQAYFDGNNHRRASVEVGSHRPVKKVD